MSKNRSDGKSYLSFCFHKPRGTWSLQYAATPLLSLCFKLSKCITKITKVEISLKNKAKFYLKILFHQINIGTSILFHTTSSSWSNNLTLQMGWFFKLTLESYFSKYPPTDTLHLDIMRSLFSPLISCITKYWQPHPGSLQLSRALEKWQWGCSENFVFINELMLSASSRMLCHWKKK